MQYICIVMIIQINNLNGQVLNIKNSGAIYISPSATLSVSGGIKIDAGGSIIHSASGSPSSLFVSGLWNNLGTYSHNSNSKIVFWDNCADTISGTANQTFYNFWINKSDSSKLTTLRTNITILKDLRLVSNNLLNIDTNTITLDTNTIVYADSISTYTTDPISDPFSSSKHITSSGKMNSGSIQRKFGNYGVIGTDMTVRFPLGTPLDTTNQTSRVYSPGRFTFSALNSTFASNANITLKSIAREYPNIQNSGVSLKRYWTVTANNITVKTGGYDVRYDYHLSDVQGNEGLYYYCLFYR